MHNSHILYVALALLVLSCGPDNAGWAEAYSDPDAEAYFDSEAADPEVDSEADSEAADPEVGRVLCITIAQSAVDWYPGIGAALVEAGLAWGVRVDTPDDCKRQLDVGEIISDAPVPPLARARLYDCRDGTRDCDPLSRGIRLNYRVAGTPWLIDRHEDDCYSGFLLKSVLIHELGHLFIGVGHDPESDARSAIPYECDMVVPDLAERNLAQAYVAQNGRPVL